MTIDQIVSNIAKRENVSINNLEYIGVTDASMLKRPRMLHQFIIRDNNHDRNGTTVTWCISKS